MAEERGEEHKELFSFLLCVPLLTPRLCVEKQ